MSGDDQRRRRRKPQLFLDCDGVLADFDRAAQKIFRMPPRDAEKKLGSRAFWTRIHRQKTFYRNLPLMPDARELFDAVAHLRPIILTGCPIGGWAEPQKVEWTAEHFPGTEIITCMSREKYLHMHPGDVLVDDYLKYRRHWEEAGGIFIHHTSAQSTIAALERIGLLKPHSSRAGEPR
jgi:5'(3')-deoxyribonucleotidase